jgi:hypothetical protein
MGSQQQGLEEIRGRLRKLEQQSRWFKQIGTAVLIVFASAVVMAQAPLKKSVEANEFILRDSSGNIRARLSMQNAIIDNGVPQMVFLDAKGTTNLEFDGSAIGALGGAVGVNDQQGRRVSTLFANSSGGAFWVSNGNPMGKGSSLVSLLPGNVEVIDEEGFEAGIGTEDLVTPHTGETHKTSAASLVLFDKNKNVIWKAP